MKAHSIANKQASTYVARRSLFKGSNLFSEMRGNAYVVYSYGYHFPLIVHVGGKWYENSDRYSASTSRHLYLCKPTGLGMEKATTGELKALIDKALMPASEAQAVAP